MRHPTIRYLIFDWSGTLSNDLIMVYEICARMFEKRGRPRITLEEFKREFELPYMRFWLKYFPNLTKEEQDRAYKEEIAKAAPPKIYPGVLETLRILRAMGMKMIVISTHPQENLLKEAQSYGISHFFEELYGSVGDKTEVILDILQRHGFTPQETAYVGDMTHDIEAGKKAGVRTIAINWGYQDAARLAALNPDESIEGILDLVC